MRFPFSPLHLIDPASVVIIRTTSQLLLIKCKHVAWHSECSRQLPFCPYQGSGTPASQGHVSSFGVKTHPSPHLQDLKGLVPS